MRESACLEESVIQAVRKTDCLYLMGIEREGLRVDKNGILSNKPRPQGIPDDLKDSYIKTDFCESQPELVTAPFERAALAYRQLSALTQQLTVALSRRGEVFWTQSMPCVLPEEKEIATSEYRGKHAGLWRAYYAKIRKRYRVQVQTICGIHCNISFSDAFFKMLQPALSDGQSLRKFKDAVYLRMVRNYIRHSWLVVLLTGCSPAVHHTFKEGIPGLLSDENGFGIGKYAVSLRTSRIGYHNPRQVEVDYDSTTTLIKSLSRAVEDGLLIDAGELYAPIKAKAKAGRDPLISLEQDGIQYLELRNIDLNMFDGCGISKEDLECIPLLMLFLLVCKEPCEEGWQQEAEQNAQLVAEEGRKPGLMLVRDKKPVSMQAWLTDIICRMTELNGKMKLCKQSLILQMSRRLLYPETGYAFAAHQLMQTYGYIEGCMRMFKNGKICTGNVPQCRHCEYNMVCLEANYK